MSKANPVNKYNARRVDPPVYIHVSTVPRTILDPKTGKPVVVYDGKTKTNLTMRSFKRSHRRKGLSTARQQRLSLSLNTALVIMYESFLRSNKINPVESR